MADLPSPLLYRRGAVSRVVGTTGEQSQAIYEGFVLDENAGPLPDDSALRRLVNLSDLSDPVAARVNLGLGSAATHEASEFATAASVAAALEGIESFPTRQTIQYVSASLAPGASEVGAVTLATGYRLYAIQTSRPARVRLYTTAAARTADAGREIGVPPADNTGVMFEYVTEDATLQVISPVAEGYQAEAPPTSAVPLSVTNKDVSTGTVTVTLTYVRTEL